MKIPAIAGLFLVVFLSTQAQAETRAEKFVAAARALENSQVRYTSAYSRIPYPMGDVSPDIGVCSDVVIRAYRKIGIDLQQLVHEDMKVHFDLYPHLWGMKHTDPNIDHRRVPNLGVFFARKGKTLRVTERPEDYKQGDIVTWNLKKSGSLPHIGIVTDKRAESGRPMMMHNIGNGQVLEDMIFDYKITGHYRYGLEQGSR